MTDKICVGAIAGAFGVRGELRLKSFTATPEDIATYGPLETEDGACSFAVTLTGQTTNALTARLSGVQSKEEADALRGTQLYVARDRLPSLPDDEYYHADLIGLEVFDSGGGSAPGLRPPPGYFMPEEATPCGTSLPSPVLSPQAGRSGPAPQGKVWIMLEWILILLAIAAIAAMFGFGRLSGVALSGAKLLVVLALVIFLLMALGVFTLA